jgi:hypothetical protein
MSGGRPPSWAPADWGLGHWLSPPDPTQAEASSSNVAGSSRHTSDKGEDEIEMVHSPQQTVPAQQVNTTPKPVALPEPVTLSSDPAVYIDHDRDREVKYVFSA